MLGFQLETLDQIFENSPLPVHILDRDGIICWANAQWLKALGYERPDVIGVMFTDIMPPESRDTARVSFNTLVADGGHLEEDVKILKKDGTPVDYRITSASLDDSKNFHYAQCILFNISKNKDIEKELVKMSMNDYLTGLYNRKKIIEIVETEVARVDRYGGELTILMVDINHMKDIIARLGHVVGDRAVIRVSDIVKKLKRTSDSVGRYADDKFIIVLPETSSEGAMVYAERLAYEATLPIPEGQGLTLTLSIGISEFNEDVVSFDEMINSAYSALLEGTVEGKSTVSVYGA